MRTVTWMSMVGGTYTKKPGILRYRASESGGYLLSHNAVQYHRRCCLSLPCALSQLPSPSPLRCLPPLPAPLLSALSRVRAPQARTPPPDPRL